MKDVIWAKLTFVSLSFIYKIYSTYRSFYFTFIFYFFCFWKALKFGLNIAWSLQSEHVSNNSAHVNIDKDLFVIYFLAADFSRGSFHFLIKNRNLLIIAVNHMEQKIINFHYLINVFCKLMWKILYWNIHGQLLPNQ